MLFCFETYRDIWKKHQFLLTEQLSPKVVRKKIAKLKKREKIEIVDIDNWYRIEKVVIEEDSKKGQRR